MGKTTQEIMAELMKNPDFKEAYEAYDLDHEIEHTLTDVQVAIRMAYAKGYEAAERHYQTNQTSESDNSPSPSSEDTHV